MPSKLFLFTLLLGGIVLTVIAAQMTQETRQHASQLSTHDVPVLVLEYFPRDSTNPEYLDTAETGWDHNHAISEWEDITYDSIQDQISFLSDATRYHGYKNILAPSFLHFTVADTKKYYTPIPRGQPPGPGQTAYTPNYKKILSDANICNYVNSQGVREVWMFGYHSQVITPSESRMSSPFHADVANDGQQETDPNYQYKMPICNHSYTLYNFTYQPRLPDGNVNIANMIHDRMHEIENLIPFLEGPSFWPPTPQNRITGVFWGDFAKFVGQPHAGGRASCGDTHYTPLAHFITGDFNGNNPEHTIRNGNGDAYIYDLNYTDVQSNCENWPKQEYEQISCNNWGCSDIGYYKWWMQNLPGYGNAITYNGKRMKNWWEALYDLDAWVASGRTIFCSNDADCHFSPLPETSTTIIPTIAEPTGQLIQRLPTPTPTLIPSRTPIITSSPPIISSPPQPTFADYSTSYKLAHLPSYLVGNTSTANESKFPLYLSADELVQNNSNPPATIPVIVCFYTQQVSQTTDADCPGALYKTTDVVNYASSSKSYLNNGFSAHQIIPTGEYYLSISIPGFVKWVSPIPIYFTEINISNVPPVVFSYPGDANGDGHINTLDLNILTNCYNKPSNEDNCINADFNEDGTVNNVDYTILMKYFNKQ